MALVRAFAIWTFRCGRCGCSESSTCESQKPPKRGHRFFAYGGRPKQWGYIDGEDYCETCTPIILKAMGRESNG